MKIRQYELKYHLKLHEIIIFGKFIVYSYFQIQYDKQCGEDNTCETGLTMKLLPLANGGEYIVSGKDRNLEVKVGLMNAGENAYNIIVDVTVAGNLTSIRSPETTG